MNAKEIFEKLVERAWGWSLFSSRRHTKPGELVERLSDEEREELKNLSSKDVQVSDNRLMYIQGQYGENTTSTHVLFPKKSDEENE